MRSITLLAFACLAPIAVTASAADEDSPPAEAKATYIWTADPAHSSIVFQTGDWGVVDLVGWFEEYEITVHSSELDFSDAVIEARIDPASVRMPNPQMAAIDRGRDHEPLLRVRLTIALLPYPSRVYPDTVAAGFMPRSPDVPGEAAQASVHGALLNGFSG